MSGILGIIGAVTTIIDRIIPDPDKKMEINLALEELKNRSDFAQIEANAAQASNPSLFVSGARPFVMWIGAFGLLMAYIVQPILSMWVPEAHLPHFPLDHMESLVYALLGIAGMRSFDKFKGTTK